MLYIGRWICKISTNASGTIIIISLCVAHSKVTTPRALFFVFYTPAFLAHGVTTALCEGDGCTLASTKLVFIWTASPHC